MLFRIHYNFFKDENYNFFKDENYNFFKDKNKLLLL